MSWLSELGKGVSRALTAPKSMGFLGDILNMASSFIPGVGQVKTIAGALSGDPASIVSALSGGANFSGASSFLSNPSMAGLSLGGKSLDALQLKDWLPTVAGMLVQNSQPKSNYMDDLIKQQAELLRMQTEAAKGSTMEALAKSDDEAYGKYLDALNNAVTPALQNVENRLIRTTGGARGIDTEQGVQKGAIAAEANKVAGNFRANQLGTRSQRSIAGIGSAIQGVAGGTAGALQADLNNATRGKGNIEGWMKIIDSMFKGNGGTAAPNSVSDPGASTNNRYKLSYTDQPDPSKDWFNDIPDFNGMLGDDANIGMKKYRKGQGLL